MTKFEQIINNTYSGISVFYRDTDVPETILSQYKVGHVVMEALPIFVSSKAGGLTRSVRFFILSNQAREAVQPGEENKYSAFSLPPFSCFKIIDIHNLDGQVQVTLIRFAFGYMEAFNGVETSVEKELIEKARADFEQKVDADLLMEMEEDQWKQATSLPVGVDPEGRFNLLPPVQQAFRDELLGVNTDAPPPPEQLQYEASGAVQALFNETFNHLSFFWRDTDLSADKVEKYQQGQILVERAFTDVTYKNGGLAKNLRYTIASSNGKDLGQLNPEVAKYGFVVLPAMTLFKVLDVYTVGDKTQVLLLNFPTYGAGIMCVASTDVEDQMINEARRLFDEQLKMEPIPELQEQQWTGRTAFPIGMDDNGNFFL